MSSRRRQGLAEQAMVQRLRSVSVLALVCLLTLTACGGHKAATTNTEGAGKHGTVVQCAGWPSYAAIRRPVLITISRAKPLRDATVVASMAGLQGRSHCQIILIALDVVLRVNVDVSFIFKLRPLTSTLSGKPHVLWGLTIGNSCL